MNKYIFLLIFVLVSIPFTYGVLCKSESIVPCTVQTPSINCDNYTVINKGGTNVQNGTMSLIEGGVYNFTLNVPIANGYTILLCSNHTTQISIIPLESEDTGKGAIFLGLILTEFFMALMFLYFSYILGGEYDTDQYGSKVEKFVILRIFLVVVSLVWVFKIYSAITVLVEGYIGISQLVTILGITAYGWIFYTFITVYVFIMFFYLMSTIKQRKFNSIHF